MQQRRLTEEPRLATAGTADHQNVFISGILRLLWTARHCDPLRLRHGDVLEKVLVHVGSNIRRRTPAGRTILDPVAILLSVLAFQVDRHAKDHCTGYADQQVRGMKTEPRGGKCCREAVPDRKQLAGKVSTGRKPESLCQLIEGIHEQKIREIQQKQFFHVHLCTLRSLTFTFSRSMVRCSAFSAACSFAWVSRSRMEGFSSRLIFRLANS